MCPGCVPFSLMNISRFICNPPLTIPVDFGEIVQELEEVSRRYNLYIRKTGPEMLRTSLPTYSVDIPDIIEQLPQYFIYYGTTCGYSWHTFPHRNLNFSHIRNRIYKIKKNVSIYKCLTLIINKLYNSGQNIFSSC